MDDVKLLKEKMQIPDFEDQFKVVHMRNFIGENKKYVNALDEAVKTYVKYTGVGRK